MYTPTAILLLASAVLCQEMGTTDSTIPTTVDVAEKDSCVNTYQEPGKCVPYYLCNVTIVNDRDRDLIDIHIPYQPCDSYLHICCIESSIVQTSVEQREGCGWKNPIGIPLEISNTIDTRPGEFPWVVAIFKTDDEPKGQYLGSGSLIDRRVVLTTAHHVVTAKKLRVRAGEWDAESQEEVFPHQDIDVESTAVHKDYYNKNLFYDIAILFLSKPVDLVPNVGIACLPPPKIPAEPETKCQTTEWGKNSFGSGRYHATLRKTELTIVPHRSCRDKLRKTRLGNLFELHHTFMCAVEGERDGCVGDGGSPLVCPMEFQEDRFVQYGMTAWSIGCGQPGSPSVFVDVSVLRDWIDNEVRGKGIESLEYAKY